MKRLIGTAAALAVLGIAAPAASADIIALTTKPAPAPRADLDLVRVDLSTGKVLSLPAGVNSTDYEDHASITPNGSRLVFERTTALITNQARIIVTDLTTGKSSDVFTGFEAAATRPNGPSITPDGKSVLTAGPDPVIAGVTVPALTFTNLQSFPSVTYPHTIYSPGFDFGAGTTGYTIDPVATGTAPGSLIAYGDTLNPEPGGLIFGTIGSPIDAALNIPATTFEHPTIGSPEGSAIVAFDQRPNAPNPANLGNGDIVFRPAATLTGFEGLPIKISDVDTPASETRPAFTPDGRYLGFIRVGADGHERVLLWDSQTQTIINSPGYDLGVLSPFEPSHGNLSLYEQFVLATTTLTTTGNVTFNLTGASGVGILVQRVVGHHTLFGRRVPTLKLIGRVPFGKFAKGKRHVKWNFKVNGKRLRPGTYQVTVRAVTPTVQIRDLGKPHIIMIR